MSDKFESECTGRSYCSTSGRVAQLERCCFRNSAPFLGVMSASPTVVPSGTASTFTVVAVKEHALKTIPISSFPESVQEALKVRQYLLFTCPPLPPPVDG